MSLFIEFAVNIFPERLLLLTLEVSDGHALPGTARAIQRYEREFEHRPLAEGMWNRLGAAPFVSNRPPNTVLSLSS